jgi:hypothetical protein
MRPDSIEVYYENKHICTAWATDSEVGRAVTAARVAAAQRRQEKGIKEFIDEGRAALSEAQREIEKSGQKQSGAATQEQAPAPGKARPKQAPEPSRVAQPARKKRRDVWDQILELGG